MKRGENENQEMRVDSLLVSPHGGGFGKTGVCVARRMSRGQTRGTGGGAGDGTGQKGSPRLPGLGQYTVGLSVTPVVTD